MDGCPLAPYDTMSAFQNYNNETTCSTDTIMDKIGTIIVKPWQTLITMKEDLINYMKDDYIIDQEPTKELDELSNTFIQFMKEFKEQKKTLDEVETLMKLTIESNQKDIQVLRTFIDFLSKISDQTDKEIEPIQMQIMAVCNDIKKTSTIQEVKEQYKKEKIKFYQQLQIIKLINQMNVGSICSICLQDNVNSYFNPCGHTGCAKCCKTITSNNNPCPLCRKDVRSIHKLFFT